MGVADCRLPKPHCRPADGMFDYKGPLSGTIVPNTLTEVNEEVKLATAGQKRKQGLYLSFTPTEKARVVQYINVNGVRAAIRQYYSRDSIENLSMAH